LWYSIHADPSTIDDGRRNMISSQTDLSITVPDDDAHYPAYCQISEGSYRLYRCFSFVMNWMMNGDDDMHRDDRQLNGDYNHHHSRH